MGKIIDVRTTYEAFASGADLSAFGEVEIYGWARTNRNSGQIGFIELHDGTAFKSIQVVYSSDDMYKVDPAGYQLIKELEPEEALKLYNGIAHITTAAAIKVVGTIVMTPEMKQPFEIHAKTVELLGDVAEDYPLQKKRASLEFLREIAYLRPRANTFQAVFRVRSVLAMAVHTFFQERGFVYVHTPEITGNDAEGAGSVFTISTEGTPHPYTDFYGTKASLTVSGQLHVEAFALAFKDVYTFGPTFRAEKSNTKRHASEFWMIEPELAFCDLNGDMECIEACIKFCIRYVLEKCPDEMAFFSTWIDKGLMDKLNAVLNTPFTRMDYTEGIKILQEAVKNGHKFDYSNIEWGMDLQSEHERYLTEEVVKGPTFLINYPEAIKAFYMKENGPDKVGPNGEKTVAACDLLVPGEGEIVGGSQREEIYEVLKAKMDKLGNTNGLEWYLNLRKYGGCVHSGFGIGFDRLLMYITGIDNIRDTEPYPRTSNALKY